MCTYILTNFYVLVVYVYFIFRDYYISVKTKRVSYDIIYPFILNKKQFK